jgi:hypothetical protein
MKFVQRFLIGIGGMALAAAALIVAVPKTAHAVTAALVQVMNTRSTPVPNQDVDAPGRNIYQQTCSYTIIGYGPAYCNVPPAGENLELVIQSVSFKVAGGAPQDAELYSEVGGVFSTTYIPLTAQGPSLYAAASPVVRYADAGNSPTCYVNPVSVTSPVTMSCTVTGYVVSLP